MYDHMRKRHSIDFSLGDFHNRFLGDKKYIRLHTEWIKSGRNKQLKPSLDRIDSRKHYYFRNVNMITWAENRFKQSAIDRKMTGWKPAVLQILGDKVIKRFPSQRHAVMELGLSQSNLSEALNGKRETVYGYVFKYEGIKEAVK